VDLVYTARWVPQLCEKEEVWLLAARRGEPAALEQFYNVYYGRVYALCFRMVARPDDAQDAAQTTFIRAFRELPRFRGDSAVKTWLYRIAVNESLGLLRKRRDTPELSEEWPTADEAPSVVDQLAVREALARTKPAHRAILVLRFWEGLNYEEIALVLGISLSAAKMRLLRAREEFRKCYEQE
jgi:RNA polymerase sigma-70 factor (ECF subfamily)